jgi:hypothetical protein
MISDLAIGASLSIRKGGEAITWMRKVDSRGPCIRRFHYRNGKLLRVADNRALGSTENDEYAFRIDQGFRAA